jgi:hypothetical protein
VIKDSVIDRMNTNVNLGVFFPLFWIIKDSNIIISKGKIGTATLVSICDYSCYDRNITGNELISLVEDNGFTVHFLMREPKERFRVGMLEDWCGSNDYNPELYKLNLAQFNNVEEFVSNRISLVEKSTYEQDFFHIGNWLSDVITIIEYLPNESYKIWKLDELSLLLFSIGVENVDKTNQTRNKPKICQHFLDSYDRLPKNLVERIENYLTPETKLYHKLISDRV